MNLHAKDSCPDSGAVVFQRGSIYMTTDNEHSGTLRTDQEANLARLDDFQVLTSDLRIQLHRLEKSGGTLRPLLENHVLTVLAVLVVHCHCQSIIFISSYFLYALILGKNTCRYKTRPSCRFNLSMQIETAGRK